jgi:hypothetical protein
MVRFQKFMTVRQNMSSLPDDLPFPTASFLLIMQSPPPRRQFVLGHGAGNLP